MVRATKPNIRIIIQARTDSNRLPAKALLPVAGTPSAILAAKRAGNRGRPVMLATSDRPTDDLLATLANQAGINVFRGSANDVLGRFVASCQDLQGDDVVVRLTADNLLPDGMLIEELLASFELNGNPYINAKIAWGDSPYGLGAEVMNVCTLRRAALTASTEYEREHVTPEIKKHIPSFRMTYFKDHRQEIADSWPQYINDDAARTDWLWKHEYDLPTMVQTIIDKIKGEQNINTESA